MARKSKISTFKKVVITIIALIAFEGVYLGMNMPRTAPDDATRIASSAAGAKGADQGRKEQLKIQLAVIDFKAANKGKLPRTLDELVPQYFPVIPIDPSTGKAYEYRVDGAKFFVGTSAGSASGKSGEAAAAAASEKEQRVLMNVIEESPGQRSFVYNPVGRKDPFLPFDVSPDLASDEEKTPLERTDVKSWRMTAVIDSAEGPAAIVEDASGHGYTVRKGTKIGLRAGVIEEITAEKIVVVESETDFTGEEKQRLVEIPMQALQGRSKQAQ